MTEEKRRKPAEVRDVASPSASPDSSSLLDASLSRTVLQEKFVLSNFRTTSKQRQTLEDFVNSCDNRNSIPIEWVIDIADESNGWFYGTAYDYNDKDQTLHVMVPDRSNPTFDGVVPLDYRSLHLIECIDGSTDALFNKIVRNSVQKIKWDVEWYEEEENSTGEGAWTASVARYYIQMTNQILVEDTGQESTSDQKSYVLLTVDQNIKLMGCQKGRGQADFDRLVLENIVLSGPDVVKEITERHAEERKKKTPSKSTPGMGQKDRRDAHQEGSKPLADEPEIMTSPLTKENVENLEMKSMSVRRIADYTKNLRDNIEDILEEREKNKSQLFRCARKFKAFALDGDLKQGLSLLEDFESVKNPKHQSGRQAGEDDGEINDAVEAVKARVGKIETGLHILMKSNGNISSNLSEELDALKRAQRKLQKELDNRDKEISRLKSTIAGM